MNRVLSLLTLLLFLSISQNLWSQETVVTTPALKAFERLSITASLASPAYPVQNLGQFNFKDLTHISLGELSISYQLNDRFAFGLGNIGNLGNCLSGYFDAEGKFFPLSDDDDDEMDDEAESEMEDDGDLEEDDCDDELLDNLMGIFTANPFQNFPLFFQVAGGYSFGKGAPAYSAMIAYRQPLFKGLGLTGGFRYSNVLYKLPANAVATAPSNGIRLEVGLNWAW